jgi:hypothetical protein
MKNNINTKRKFQIINAVLPQVLIHLVMTRVAYIAWPLLSELHLPVAGRLGESLCARLYSDSLRAGRSGGRISVGVRFPAPVQIGPGAYPASSTMGTGSLPVSTLIQ